MNLLRKLAVLALVPAFALALYAFPAVASHSDDDTVLNSNSASVTNNVSSSANTGYNLAGGADGGDGGNGGDIENDGDDQDVDDSSTGNGGAGGDAGVFSGGSITTGDATAVSAVENDVNSNDTRINRCGCDGDSDGDVVVRNRNDATVRNTVDSDANSGYNLAGGADGGDGGNGGDIENDDSDGDQDVDDSTTGNGGAGGDSGEGGTILTGNSTAVSAVVNVLNRNVTRIRR